MSKISAVITTYNSESKIASCLASLTWVDEIVVIDDGSTDKTVEIAKKFTKKIYHHQSKGYVEPARNFSISKATHEWVLVLDADEQVSQKLAEALQEVTQVDKQVAAVAIPRKNIIFNKWIQHAGWWPDYQIRFFQKGKVIWSDVIHSKPEIYGTLYNLDTVEELALIHHNYDTISDFISRMDRYTSIEAKELSEKREHFSIERMVKKMNDEFLSRFFLREGYKDGMHGVFLSLLESYSMLVVSAKLWEKERFEEQDISKFFPSLSKHVRAISKEQAYWFLTLQKQLASNPVKKLWYILIRKLLCGK